MSVVRLQPECPMIEGRFSLLRIRRPLQAGDNMPGFLSIGPLAALGPSALVLPVLRPFVRFLGVFRTRVLIGDET